MIAIVFMPITKLPTLSNEIATKFSRVGETALRRVVKPDPKDMIVVEIGDTKQPDFKPQIKINRWGTSEETNEVNFSLRAQEHPQGRVETEGDKVKYITPDYEVHQYDKPDVSEDGGHEFEWVLPKKPKINVLTATIQIKGLNFFYQSPLTQEEIDEGTDRPDNVVGSYAVYHSTKGRMNDAAGMDYKTGKAFHLYRAKATDANNDEVWCDYNTDLQETGILTTTIPQEFLDSATYPVRIK